VNAADKCGKEIDVGLSIKINRCGLDKTFSKLKNNKTSQPSNDYVKPRAFSSYQNKRSKIGW